MHPPRHTTGADTRATGSRHRDAAAAWHDVRVSLADVQDDLYGRPADEFVRRRAGEVRAAKQRGDRELADAIAALRKPTAAAQLVNSFARACGAEIEELLAVGTRLRRAVDRGDGDEIRAAMRDRMRTVAALMRSLRQYSVDRGDPLSASVASQVEQSLRAATTSEEHATELRRGVLVAALPESGVDALRAAPGHARAGTAVAPDDPDDPAAHDEPADVDGTQAPTSRRRAAEERVSAVADAVAGIRGELQEAATRRAALDEERRTVRDRLDQLEQQLEAAHRAESDIGSRLRAAESELKRARSAARRLR